MSRGLSSAVETALSQQHVAIVTFAKLEFPSGTVYVHNSIGTYNWDSQDWLGVGDLGAIGKVQEGQDAPGGVRARRPRGRPGGGAEF